MHGFGTTNCKTSGMPEFFEFVRFEFVRKSVLRLLGNPFDFVRKQFVFLFIYFYFMSMLQSRMLKRRVWKLEAMRLCEKLEEMSVGFSSCLVWDQTCHEL